MTVTFETAKRLADAGFPQPLPQRGQVWFLEGGMPLVVTSKSDAIDMHLCDYVVGGSMYIYRYLNDGEVFAQTATDILQHLPGWNLSKIEDGWRAWFGIFPKKGYSPGVFTNENPAEAAAEAWFFDNKHKP